MAVCYVNVGLRSPPCARSVGAVRSLAVLPRQVEALPAYESSAVGVLHVQRRGEHGGWDFCLGGFYGEDSGMPGELDGLGHPAAVFHCRRDSAQQQEGIPQGRVEKSAWWGELGGRSLVGQLGELTGVSEEGIHVEAPHLFVRGVPRLPAVQDMHRRADEHERRHELVGGGEVDEPGKRMVGSQIVAIIDELPLDIVRSGGVAVTEFLVELDPISGAQVGSVRHRDPFSRSIISTTASSTAIDEGCVSPGKVALADATPTLTPASKPRHLRSLPGNCGTSARILFSDR